MKRLDRPFPSFVSFVHSSLATTDRYIRHLNPQQVVDAMRGRK